MRKKMEMVLKTITFVLVAVMLLTFCGCGGATYVWYQGGKDKATFTKDNLECEEESAQYAKYLDKRGDKEVISSRMKECMGLRGYVKVLEQDVPQGMEKF